MSKIDALLERTQHKFQMRFDKQYAHEHEVSEHALSILTNTFSTEELCEAGVAYISFENEAYSFGIPTDRLLFEFAALHDIELAEPTRELPRDPQEMFDFRNALRSFGFQWKRMQSQKQESFLLVVQKADVIGAENNVSTITILNHLIQSHIYPLLKQKE